MDPDCAAKGIPEHLHTAGRLVDQTFEDTESLFIRFPVNERELKLVLNFRHRSCNRSKYSSDGEDDVLWNSEQGGRYDGWGVVGVTVEAIRSIQVSTMQPEARLFSLCLEHKPERCNYPHSEIVALENGAPCDDIKPKSVKKQIREALHEKIIILLPPEMKGELLQA